MENKIKQIEIEEVSYELDGSLSELKELILSWEKTYSHYDNLRIVTEICYDGGYYIFLKGDRLETDEEVKNRILADKKREEEQVARKKAQYLALKAEFEPDEN